MDLQRVTAKRNGVDGLQKRFPLPIKMRRNDNVADVADYKDDPIVGIQRDAPIPLISMWDGLGRKFVVTRDRL
jgi:hypothetical protein